MLTPAVIHHEQRPMRDLDSFLINEVSNDEACNFSFRGFEVSVTKKRGL